ncbi:MFS transporter [Lagierella sp.]|uniref:MFS transporter n=1 Tax=Lagierella sp. TaxID=2849657 RepID=UPI002607496F|nr:MFS transporter [Lagierella sp.]
MERKNVYIYYFSQILLFVAASLFNPVSYMFYMDNGLSASIIGISISILWISSGIFEIPCGIFTDRHGTKNTMILSTGLSILGLGLLIIKTNTPLLLLSSFIFGVSSAANSGCLSSWIVNYLKSELNETFEQSIIQKVFSTSNIYTSIISIIFSFLVLQIIYKINPKYPIYLSFIAYTICLLFFFLIFPKRKRTQKEKKNKLRNTFKSYTKVISKEFILLSIYFTIPSVMDMGPVNQWSIVFRDTNLLGVIQVLIVGSFVLGNWMVSKTKIQQKDILKLVIFDVLLIIFLSVTDKFNKYIPIFFFLAHVVINTITLAVNMSYFHSNVITDDKNRNTLFSTFSFLNSLIVGLLLVFQGFLSDVLGMSNSWALFSAIGCILYYTLHNKIMKKSN